MLPPRLLRVFPYPETHSLPPSCLGCLVFYLLVTSRLIEAPLCCCQSPPCSRQNPNPLTLALQADKIFQSCVSSAYAVNHVSSASFLGDDYSIQALHPQASAQPLSSSTPDHSSCRAPASRRSDLPSLCWYHRSHAEKAQKCRAPCSWSGN